MNFSTCESLVQGQAVNITPVWFTIKCEVHILCIGRVSLRKQPSFVLGPSGISQIRKAAFTAYWKVCYIYVHFYVSFEKNKTFLFHYSSASLQISMQLTILKAKENSFNYNYCKAIHREDSIISLFSVRRMHFSQAVETTISTCGTWNQEHVR